MIKWNSLCLPKDFGGMEIIDAKIMFEVLLGKWFLRSHSTDEHDTCCNLLSLIGGASLQLTLIKELEKLKKPRFRWPYSCSTKRWLSIWSFSLGIRTVS
jgi:hypothetical protein